MKVAERQRFGKSALVAGHVRSEFILSSNVEKECSMHDDQFTAMGPPFGGSGFPQAGFSTVSEGGGFQFGVRVNAGRCGVVGQTLGGGIAGVLGQGRFSQFGVLGTAFPGSIGVVGVSVSTTNDLFNLNVPPGSFNLDSLGVGHGTGVLGKSTTGFGVHGISTSNTAVVGQIVRTDGEQDPTGFGVHGIAITNTAVVGNSESGFGVHGIAITNTAVVGNSETGIGVHGISGSSTGVVGSSEGNGFGVHGIAKSSTGLVGESDTGLGVHGIGKGGGEGVRGSSAQGNGGVFESQQGAQVRLIPKTLASPEGQLGGFGGELLATADTDESGQTFGLWFCTQGGSAGSAVWQLVAGARPFPGMLIAQGSQGIHVMRIQLQLNLIAGARLVVDGKFGALTEQAVIDFQNAQQIDADGIVGPVTWAKLFAVI